VSVRHPVESGVRRLLNIIAILTAMLVGALLAKLNLR
jgi:hypothetical protein